MHPENLYELVQESAQWLRENGVGEIDVGIILGSGLGAVAESFDVIADFAYEDIPNLAGTSVMGHNGVLQYVRCGDVFGLIFKGRIHYYEGYEMWEVAYPVRVLKMLGARALITTGAAGGLNPEYCEGDIVLLNDHINLMPESPLRGPHDPRMGERFPDMSAPYSSDLREMFMESAKNLDVPVYQGVYAGLPGPSLETRSEYSYLHGIGADLVAMSIIPEVLVAAQVKLDTVAICVVSNACFPPQNVGITTIEHVVDVVKRSAPAVARLIQDAI